MQSTFLINWFTPVGVRQRATRVFTLTVSFQHLSGENYATDTLMISKEQSAVGGITITSLRFANDIDGRKRRGSSLSGGIARTTAAPGRLKTIWNDKHLSLTSTDQTSALLYTLAWLSQYCCTLSKPGHSGHSEEIAVGLAKTILQGTAQGK